MGVVPYVHYYNILINGFYKIKMIDETMNFFKEIHFYYQIKIILLNIITYTIYYFCIVGQGMKCERAEVC